MQEHAHQWSMRSQETFVTIQCVADSEEQLENELFGYWDSEAQCFQKGKLEQAHRGTLYFDELGALPHSTQDKLHHLIYLPKYQKFVQLQHHYLSV